jgi:hypothetical protein
VRYPFHKTIVERFEQNEENLFTVEKLRMAEEMKSDW